VDADGHVRGADGTGSDHDRRPAGQLAVRLGHEGRTAFVARWMAAPGFAMALFLLFASQWFDWSFIVFPAWALLISVYILVANFERTPVR
jgi:hypothetical protein